MPPRRVVLLGFMASGKTAVARALARRLGWTHVDFDREIERHAGLSVAEIFQRHGEAHFRRLEAELTPRLLRGSRRVLSPGGGWVANPGLFDSLPPDTLTIWLRVSAEELLRRLGRDHARQLRPLLRGDDPEARVRALLAEREPLYGRADHVVDTDGREIDEVAAELERILQGSGRTPSHPRSHTQHGP